MSQKGLEDETNFDAYEKPVSEKIKKNRLGLVDFDHMDQINQEFASSKEAKEDLYDFHLSRTSKNISRFVEHFFSVKQSENRLVFGVFLGEDFHIEEVISNPKNTIVFVFWNCPNLKDDEKRKKINRNLKKFGSYLRKEICQRLSLRFAPEVRFKESHLYNKGQEEFKRMEDHITTSFDESPDFDEMDPMEFEKRVKGTQEAVYHGIMSEVTNEDQIHKRERKKPERDLEGKKIRRNRTEDGKRKKNRKEEKAERFWKSLMSS